MKNSIKLFLLSALTFSVLAAHSQENDDMYFSKKDRKKLKPIEEAETKAVQEAPAAGSSFLTRQNQYYNSYDPNLDTLVNGVSQESIDKYKRSNIDQYDGDYYEDESSDVYYESDGVISNSNYSDADGYYDDERVVVNNYYRVDPFANRRFNSRWNVGYGWNGWGSGLYISYGRGWNRWNRWNRWNDPFWDPYYAWGNPWNSWGWGNTWASWGGYGWGGFYDPFWCPPYGGGFYRNSWVAGYYNGYNRGYYGTIRDGRVAGRTVQRGARNSRGGSVSGSGRSRQLRNVAVGQTRDSRSFSDTQSRYLDRSRRSAQVSNRSGSTGDIRSRNRSVADGINRSNSSRVGNSSRTRTGSYTLSGRSGSGRSSGSVRSSGSTRSRSSSGSFRSSGSSSRNSGSVRSSGSSRSSSGYRPSSSSSRSSSGSFRSSGSSSRSSGSVRSSSSRSSSSRSSGSVRSSSSRSSSGSRSSSSSRSSSRSSSSRSRGN